jgi:UDP-N-acetylmuramoyl-tripeptide--D-alanyl-D-alanine ligase
MKAAIENFAKLPNENKLFILGDMFELGEYAEEEHKKIVELLTEKKMDNVILIGPEFIKASPTQFKSFITTADCLGYLMTQKQRNKFILIKGSRGMKLEMLKDAL